MDRKITDMASLTTRFYTCRELMVKPKRTTINSFELKTKILNVYLERETQEIKLV
jgi:hypothetical protein